VPLAPAAREIVATVKHNGEYVFTTNSKTPITGWSRLKPKLDRLMGNGIEPWRIHDLRRTGLNEASQPEV
jgi:hypothetical protein